MGQEFPLVFSRLNAMPEVTASEAKQIIDRGSQLLDVRTDVEYAAGHIPGARHIPLSDVQRESTGLDKDQPVVIYCRSGNRSGPAADAFAASGWDAHSIEGGLLGWAEAGLELEPEGGAVAENPNMPPP
jgi:rhodanese-related sulfurtransferase